MTSLPIYSTTTTLLSHGLRPEPEATASSEASGSAQDTTERMEALSAVLATATDNLLSWTRRHAEPAGLFEYRYLPTYLLLPHTEPISFDLRRNSFPIAVPTVPRGLSA